VGVARWTRYDFHGRYILFELLAHRRQLSSLPGTGCAGPSTVIAWRGSSAHDIGGR